MPLHMADLVQKALAQLVVISWNHGCLSWVTPIWKIRMTRATARARLHDPYVTEYQGDVYEKAQSCDAAVIMVRHKQYLELDLPRLKEKLRMPVLVDGRRVLNSHAAKEAGFTVRSVGVTSKVK
jgi:UDP-N-acetyl-D-mannosaminuronate dehydrogenase